MERKVNVRANVSSFGVAEIVSERIIKSKRQYYVHYLNQDRRLDEWVDESLVHINLKSENGIKDKKDTNKKSNDGHQDTLAKEHLSLTKIRNIEKVVIGLYEIVTWYYSPYPDEYGTCSVLYVCDGCLIYMQSMEALTTHKKTCIFHHPPGKKVYERGSLRLWKVDGAEEKLYCQCLCLLAKLFIDHKTLYYDVEPFTFYVLTEADTGTLDTPVALFSRENISYDDYNLATIITLPPFQRRQYGRLLIEISYALRKRDGLGPGTPERPLSDLGLRGYLSYWRMLILHHLLNIIETKATRDLPPSAIASSTIQDIADNVFLKPEDVILTLSYLGLLDKRWKSITDYTPSQDVIVISKQDILNQVEKHPIKLYKIIDEQCFIEE